MIQSIVRKGAASFFTVKAILPALVSAALLLVSGVARAATINVTTTNMAKVNDGQCALSEAVEAVNNQAPYLGCPAGNGNNDLINVPAGDYWIWGAMTVERSVEIAGAGRDSTIVNSGGTWAFSVQGSNLQVRFSGLTMRKRDDQTDLPVMGLYVKSTGSLFLEDVRVADFNEDGISIRGFNDLSVEIADSIVTNNRGRGFDTLDADVIILRTTISNNQKGGIECNAADGFARVEIDRSIVQNNGTGTILPGNGGGISQGGDTDSQLAVENSLIAGNQAEHKGGGIYSTGQLYVFNSTITGNSAGQGAGVFHEGGPEMQMKHATVAGNTASQRAGGVFATGGNQWLRFTIVADNFAPTHPDVEGFFVDEPGNYNLIENISGASGFGGTDKTGVDPKLGALQNMGGPTSVLPLLAGSPAIDAIPQDPLPGTHLFSDQRRSPRPRDGDDDGGAPARYDIGAFEQGPIEAEFLNVAATTSSVNHVVFTDMLYSRIMGTRFEASANGQFVTYAFPIVEPGTYSFLIRVRKGTNRGIYEVATANSLNGFYTTIGGAQDLYSASVQFEELTLGGATVTFSTAGTKYVRFRVSGKHASSTGRYLYLDRMHLRKQ